METWGYIAGAIVLVLGVVGGYWGLGVGDLEQEGLRVASFNGQVFGDAKIEKIGTEYYVDLIRDYDLFFLLEIRDKDGSSFEMVCDELVLYNYSCLVSERAGRSSSKEAVGIVWNSLEVGVSEVWSVDDEEDLFEREPVKLEVRSGEVGSEGILFYVVHLKPNDVARELEALESVVEDEAANYANFSGGAILIGDLNADCDYYSRGDDFVDWDWWISDEADTTTGATDCAYDRVISRGVEVLDSGVVEIDSEVSDHNLVWVEVAG